jgi:hypothetical protein
VKITNNLGIFDYDNITTSTNDDDDDDEAVQCIMIPQDGGTPVAAGNLASPSTITDVCLTPSLSLPYDMTIPPLPNQIYDVSDDGLDMEIVNPIVAPHMGHDSIEFLRKDDDDDASLFDGIMNDNDEDVDGSSIVAVDELLMLDRILGFDSPVLDIENDWL